MTDNADPLKNSLSSSDVASSGVDAQLAADSTQLPEASEVTPVAIATVRNYQVGQGNQEEKKKPRLFWWVAAGMVGIVLLSFLFFTWQMSLVKPEPTTTPTSEKIVLNYWGLWEQSITLVEALEGFERENPGVTVKYTKKDITNYRQDLAAAFDYAGMNAPDVFRYHASWRSMFDDNLAPVPEAVISKDKFSQQYYPVMSEQLTGLDGQLKGMPLMYDSLALVYNRDIFAKNKAEVPQNWPQLRLLAKKLTQEDPETGRILLSGVAMGLADNIDFATDIIGLLGAQRGINWANPDAKLAMDAILYYASFAKNSESKTWDEWMGNSTQAFAEGRVAMIFAPSWLIHDILKLNPVLPIGVAPVPQLNETQVADWATYWVEGVNKATAYQDAAWRLLQYFSRDEVLEKLNYEQSVSRDFGEIYPKKTLADKLASDHYVHAYLVNANKAVGFPLNDKTFDHGINETMGKMLRLSLEQALTDSQDDQQILAAINNEKAFNNKWGETLAEYHYLSSKNNEK